MPSTGKQPRSEKAKHKVSLPAPLDLPAEDGSATKARLPCSARFRPTTQQYVASGSQEGYGDLSAVDAILDTVLGTEGATTEVLPITPHGGVADHAPVLSARRHLTLHGEWERAEAVHLDDKQRRDVFFPGGGVPVISLTQASRALTREPSLGPHPTVRLELALAYYPL